MKKLASEYISELEGEGSGWLHLNALCTQLAMLLQLLE